MSIMLIKDRYREGRPWAVLKTRAQFFSNTDRPRPVNVVYLIESAAYGVVFTSCLCENPNERVRAFDTNKESI